VYYGAGYLNLKEVFKYGAIFGFGNFVIWLLVGSVWWRVIGLF
jgi:DASS family divalent anion:Na+ symporter